MLARSCARAHASLRHALLPRTLPHALSSPLRSLSSSPSLAQQPQQPASKLPDQPAVEDPFVPPSEAEQQHLHSSTSSSSSSDPTPLATPSPAAPLPPSSAPRPPVLEPEPLPEPAAPVSRVRRPVGAFRGGIIGFLLGVSLVGGYGYFQLLDDYAKASRELLDSVEELKGSTEALTTHLTRISSLESSVASLQFDTATKTELDSLRQEYRKLLEGEHLDLLNLKAHVWAMEQDLHKVSRRETSVRI
ncbi:hypothetical protein JCM8097_004215 [Rhodosporidiobolus ruineniae]